MVYKWMPVYTRLGFMLVQPTTSCCGVATIYNVLRWYGLRLTFDEIAHDTKSVRNDDGAMYMEGFLAALEFYGFTTNRFVDEEKLRLEMDAKNATPICVDANVLLGRDETETKQGNHIFLATGRQDGYYRVYDTGSGDVAHREDQVHRAMICAISLQYEPSVHCLSWDKRKNIDTW